MILWNKQWDKGRKTTLNDSLWTISALLQQAGSGAGYPEHMPLDTMQMKVVVAFFLAYEDFGRMFDNSFSF